MEAREEANDHSRNHRPFSVVLAAPRAAFPGCRPEYSSWASSGEGSDREEARSQRNLFERNDWLGVRPVPRFGLDCRLAGD